MALCFVAVLGIVLASYLAVCSRAMNLSNRTFQANLSRQLAEFGLEEGLRVFNSGDWSAWKTTPTGLSVSAWTFDNTNKRASRTVAFAAGKLAQGVTATVKIRVDNYDAAILSSTWSSNKTYRINDLVGDNASGNWIWYRSLKNNNLGGSTGDLASWAPAPIEWTWSTNKSYAQYDVVNYNGTWYRCINSLGSTGNMPTNISYWGAIPGLFLNWATDTTYAKGSMVFNESTGIWYYCNELHTSGSFVSDLGANPAKWAALPTPTGNTWRPGTYFVPGDYVYRNGVWYRCIYLSYNNPPPDNAYWVASSAPFISWMWRPATPYEFNSLVYTSLSGASAWWRCTTSHTSAASFSSTNWQNALSGNMWAWNGSYSYRANDSVYYNGNWYRCIRSHSSSQTPSSNPAYWSTSPLLNNAWEPNKQYAQYDVVRYNGLWYLSYSSGANIAQNPTNASSSYWAVATSSAPTWSSTTTYSLNDMVSYTVSGTTNFYQCILGHLNQLPSNSTYWSLMTGHSYQWSPTAIYSAGSYCSYGGIWYRCVNTPLDHANPNKYSDATNPYWLALGGPVFYAESTVDVPASAAIKTQLRATAIPCPLFPNALAATTISAEFSTTGGIVDSYDGSIFRMDTSGSPGTAGTFSRYAYNQTSSPFATGRPNISYSAVLAATGSTSPAVSVNNTNIKGFVAASTWSKGTSAVLAGNSTPGVDLARVSRSPSIPKFGIVPEGGLLAAFTSGNFPKGLLLPSGSTVNIGTPGATTPSRYYFSTELIMGGADSDITTLNINGPVILYIRGNLTMTGSPNGLININTTGSAEIHIAGALRVDSGSEGIKNNTLDPKSLIIMSDSTASTTQYYNEGVNALYGVIYMPNIEATDGLYFNYGDSNTTTLYGAVSAKKLRFENNLIVHYDTSLRHATFGGVDQPYSIIDWRELPLSEQATMP